MEWIWILIAVILVLLGMSVFKILRLKKNIVESKLGLAICLKRKQSMIEKIISYLRQHDPEFVNKAIYEQLAGYSSIKSVDEKVTVGEELTKRLSDEVNQSLRFSIDGEISTIVNDLRIVDEKILNFEKKYNMSILEYDIARKKSVLFLFFRKHKNSEDITDIEE